MEMGSVAEDVVVGGRATYWAKLILLPAALKSETTITN